MLPQKDIQALFLLLDDPDEEVYDAVSKKLLQYGKEIIPALEHFWEHSEDEALQDRITQLIHRVNFQDLYQEFNDWTKADVPELLRGAILVARFQYPGLNLPFLLTQFEQVRKNIWLELNNYLTALEKINIFNGILYNYYKFQGQGLNQKRAEYFCINRLLESKQGNVYSIGLLYISLARLLDVPIFAVNVPGQFLLGYVDTLQQFYSTGNQALRRISFFVDPTNGMIYTQNDVEFYLHKMQLNAADPIYFQELDTLRIVHRLLQELSFCFEEDEQKTKDLGMLIGLLEGKIGNNTSNA